MENSSICKFNILYLGLLLIWLFCLCLPQAGIAGTQFISIAYHDVVDHRSQLTYDAVTVDNLIDHFEWLKVNGYHPVSIDDLIAARAGTRQLPDKAILLCWDDAYTSFYTHVLPLLKAYHYPAVLGIVGSWMSPDTNKLVQYGDTLVPRQNFMSWKQVKEAAASGLVEIASHSNKLHTAVLADRFGDRLPAVVTHIFDPASNTYETTPQLKERIRNDLQQNSDLLQKHLGFRPRVMVWPFGRYNTIALKAAAETGMPITLTLNPIPANTNQLQTINRLYPTYNPDLMQFRSYTNLRIRPSINHFFRVDSHDLLENEKETEHQFSLFLDRVKELNPNMVILDPVINENNIQKTLFVNSRFPLAQDRLNRLSWHTNKRAGAGVFLWLKPSLFISDTGETAELVNHFFADMGASSPVQGLVVDNPQLIRTLLDTTDLTPYSSHDLRFWNPDIQRRARQNVLQFTTHPSITAVFNALESFQQWQPFQEIGIVLSLEQFRSMKLVQFKTVLSLFDFLVINCNENNAWLPDDRLKQQLDILRKQEYLAKCSFLFTTSDQRPSPAKLFHSLPPLNIINWGYQFDRFLSGKPPVEDVRVFLSKRSFPYPITH